MPGMSEGKFFGRQSRGLDSVSKIGVALISLYDEQTNVVSRRATRKKMEPRKEKKKQKERKKERNELVRD